ncbi:MAG: hypothetical protein AAF567_11740 [Actinomycetota bacterium]
MALEPTYDPIHPDLVAAQRRFVDRPEVEAELLSNPARITGSWARKLFRQRPKQWGLRGDPWLWRELGETLALAADPQGVGAFENMLTAALEDLVGSDLAATSERSIHVDRYPLHGMSGGSISVEKWLNDLVPLLIGRYSAGTT